MATYRYMIYRKKRVAPLWINFSYYRSMYDAKSAAAVKKDLISKGYKVKIAKVR